MATDVRDEDALADVTAGVDLVFHQAARVSVERSVEAPVATTATNATGTVAVLEAARRADARTVVASASAIYGHPETVPIPEDHRADPRSPYGTSKLAADRFAAVCGPLRVAHDGPPVLQRLRAGPAQRRWCRRNVPRPGPAGRAHHGRWRRRADADFVHVHGRNGDVRHTCADVSRAREHLGFGPAIALEDGLASLAEPL